MENFAIHRAGRSHWVRAVSMCVLELVLTGILLGIGMGTASLAQTNCAPVPAGLVGWWAAEGNATDNSGAHDGSFPFGSAFAGGVVGQAFDFDGSSRRVSIPDGPAFQLTNAMSLEAWVYPRAYGGFITFRGDNRGGLDNWTLDTYESGFVKFTLMDPANNVASVRAALALNQWQHVAATWERGSGDLKIYVDGALAAQTNSTLVPIGVLDAAYEPAIGIGNHGGTFHQFPFNGLIDELGVYNRALASNEIATIFLAGSAGKCISTNPPASGCATVPPSVISWWRAENNALDEVHNNSGMLVGGMGYAAGRVGQAFLFDGVDDGVVIPDAELLNVGPGQDFTVEAWIQAEPHATEYGVMSIMSKRVAPTLVNAQGFELALHYGNLGGQLADADDQFQNFISSGPDLIDGAYHHVAMTVNRTTTNGGQLYVDGQVVLVFDPTQQSGNLGTTAPFRIGKHASDWFNGSFKGRVDEAAFYRRALAANEIVAIYNAGSLGKCINTNLPATNCVTAPSGLLAWWSAESNSLDTIGASVGGFDPATYSVGKVGTAFDFNGANNVVVPDQPSFNPTNAITIEGWVYPRALTTSYAQDLISKDGEFSGPRQYMLTMGPPPGLDNGTGGFRAHVGVPGGFYFIDGATKVQTTNWYHVAMTYDGIALKLFVNGNLDAQLAVTGPIIISSQPIRIGGGAPGSDPAYYFNGLLDEVTIYHRALALTEIQSIYGADQAGKCPPPAQSPVITQQPQDMVVIAGGTAQFEVVAIGVPAPGYQWYFQTDPLPGQTNATLVLNNVLPDKQGTYSVQVFNPSGSLFSSNATLTVVTTQAVVLVDGTTPGFYNEALGTVLDGTAPQFPLPFGRGDDPTIFPADEPDLAAATNILGDWLAAPPSLNANWQAVAVIPDTWALNTETAITYPLDAGSYGITNLRGDFDADNGIYVWVNGQFKFGARAPGLPSPAGVFEYTNVSLGSLPPGTNYIQILREDSGITAGSQIRLTGTTLSTNRQPPSIVQSPTNQTVAAGGSSGFTVVAAGTPELAYQWRFEGANLAGKTNSSLVLTSVQPTNAGGYSVLVSNPYGSVTSAIATLTVLTYPPVITRQPTNFTAIVTTPASFSVQATGSMTLTYQWLLNDSPLAGKTATTLSFTSVQFSNAGNYSVIVTNPYGAVTSSIATLTVNPLPPCTPVPDGLVSWWKGENSLIDNWDSNNARTFGNYQAGKVGQAFYNPMLTIADAPSLRLTNGLTIEAWVNPASVSSTRVILAKYEYPLAQPFGSQSAYLLGTTNNGALFFLLTPNGSVRTNATLFSTNILPVNKWSHVVATYDGDLMRLYLNGAQIAQTNYAGPIFPGATPLGIGGFPSGTSSPWQFNGLLDEVSIYSRALSAAEIQAIVAADLTGKCLAPPLITQQPQSQAVPLGEDVKLTATVLGSRPLTYQWYLNGPATQFTTQRITGATNAFLVIERVKTNNTGTYSLRMTNSVGFALSAAAQISLLPAPACTEILPGLISWWPGNSNLLDVTGLNNITSYSPLGYPTGKVASAFTFNGINSRITINNSASLNFGSNANFSIEMWVRATNSPPAPGGGSPYPNVPLFEKRTTVTTGWVGYSLSLNQGRLAFAIGTPGFAAPGAISNYISSGPDLRDAMFHHVAVTVNRSATNGGVLYVDGVPVLTFNPKPLNVSLTNTSPLYIGAPTVTLSNSFFAGLIDEPAIYNRELPAAEILAIRTAGAAGRCKSAPVIVTQPANQFVTNGGSTTLSVTVTGTPLLRYQWRRNAIPVPGGTNSTLSLSNITLSIAGTYSVIASNAFGTVTSSNAVVAINRLPIANPDTLTTPSNTAAVFPIAKLLLNDTDADGDLLNVISVSGLSAQNGTVALVSNIVTYTPPVNFTGNDTFTYLLADQPGATAVGTVMVTVGSGGAAPLNIVAGPSVAEGQFVVRFAGIPGLTYTIETAPSLAGPWAKVANLTAPETDAGLGVGIFEFREPVIGEGARYYRTVYPAY